MDIFLNDPYEERIKQLQKDASHKRRMNKLLPQPIEEKTKVTLYVVITFAIFLNLVQVITASTAVYTFLSNLLQIITFGNIFSGIIALAALIVLEYFQWQVSKPFFQSVVRDHEEPKILNLVKMIFLTAISVFLSHQGGHDSVVHLQPVPIMEEVLKEDISKIESEYNGYYNTALASANEYKSKSTYKGKLSESRSKKYNDLLAAADQKITAKETAVNEARTRNKNAEDMAKSKYNKALDKYQKSTFNQGNVLGIVVVICANAFYICMWWMENNEWEIICQYATLKKYAIDPSVDPDDDYTGPGNRTNKKRKMGFSSNSTDLSRQQFKDSGGDISITNGFFYYEGKRYDPTQFKDKLNHADTRRKKAITEKSRNYNDDMYQDLLFIWNEKPELHNLNKLSKVV